MGTFTKLTYHVVFGTRFRRPTIDPSFQESLYEYIGGIIRDRKGCLIQAGGVADHVHLLARLSPAMAVSDVLRDIKAGSSKWIGEMEFLPHQFEWQTGYGAFTVSYSLTEAVADYIRNQKEHHRVKSFQEEYMEFLKRHNINFEMAHLFEGENHG